MLGDRRLHLQPFLGAAVAIRAACGRGADIMGQPLLTMVPTAGVPVTAGSPQVLLCNVHPVTEKIKRGQKSNGDNRERHSLKPTYDGLIRIIEGIMHNSLSGNCQNGLK